MTHLQIIPESSFTIPAGPYSGGRSWQADVPAHLDDAYDDDLRGSLAWVGLVLMGFSCLAMVGLMGWFVSVIVA